MKMAYDPFGREIETWHPETAGVAMSDTANHYAPRSRMIYSKDATTERCGVMPLNAAYCLIAATDGAPLVRQYFDSVNRVIEIRTDGFNGTVYAATGYNGRGQTVTQTVPAYGAVSNVQSEFRFDALGRQVFKSEPSSLGNELRYTHYQPKGLTTQVWVTNASMPPLATSTCAAGPLDALDNDLCVTRTYATNGWLLKTTDAHGSQTRFWYDGQGNAKLIQDPQSNLTGANYNALGQRTDLFDPNQGHWSFVYNGLGEVLAQTDAQPQTTVFEYDALGRLIRRVADPADPELGGVEDTWVYDSPGPDGERREGLLAEEQRAQAFTNGVVQVTMHKTYAYDAFNRPAGFTVTNDPHYYPQTGVPDTPIFAVGPQYTVGIDYDGYFARPKAVTYPQERLRTYTRYDIDGQVKEEGNSLDYANATKFYRRVTAMSPTGQVTQETFGNGKTQNYTYHPGTFQMTGTEVSGLIDLDYQHDFFGNLIRQDDTQPPLTDPADGSTW